MTATGENRPQSAGSFLHAGVERVSVRRVSRRLGFADVRLPGVNLAGLRIDVSAFGLRITTPSRTDDQGRQWPVYSLQPGTREAVEAEIKRVWAHTEARP